MKLTRGILKKLGFKNKGRKWTKFNLDLIEDEYEVFSFDLGRIYFDVETVEELKNIWVALKQEEMLPLMTELI